jgi:hypothetical protein
MAWTRRDGSPICWPASPTTRSPALMISCPGTGQTTRPDRTLTYDVESRTLIVNETQNATVGSRATPDLQTNEDGSVDIYVGPTPPPGWKATGCSRGLGAAGFPMSACVGRARIGSTKTPMPCRRSKRPIGEGESRPTNPIWSQSSLLSACDKDEVHETWRTECVTYSSAYRWSDR